VVETGTRPVQVIRAWRVAITSSILAVSSHAYGRLGAPIGIPLVLVLSEMLTSRGV